MTYELKQNAKAIVKDNLLLCMCIAIINFILNKLPNFYTHFVGGELSILDVLIIPFAILIVYCTLNVGICNFFINLNTESNPGLSDLMFGFNNMFKIVVVALLSGLISILGCFLFLVPGIILAYMYSQVFYLIIENPDISVIDCLKESARIMKGHKMELFLLHLSFIGWLILSFLTFGIANLYVFPYYQATLANFYLEIKG